MGSILKVKKVHFWYKIKVKIVFESNVKSVRKVRVLRENKKVLKLTFSSLLIKSSIKFELLAISLGKRLVL